MSAYLLDVNVLLALSWQPHEAYAAAHTWLAGIGDQAWATNAITQVGLLRLLTNPTVVRPGVSATGAIDALNEVLDHPGHQFWPLDHDIHADLLPLAPKLRGHRLWTDALLLTHAARRGGVFVTFDSGVQELASGGLAERLLVLNSRGH
jgi:toxin-antitoxin system PIN domain toxin